MSKNYKLIESGPACREKLLSGINQVADILKLTLGTFGRNVLIFYKGRPNLTNDGATIARHIVLKDPVEDGGAQAIIDVAAKTSDMVGDGTTTSVVLAQAIVNEVFQKIKKGMSALGNQNSENLMAIKKEVEDACKLVVEEIKKIAKPIKTKEDLEKIAITSCENEEIGKKIAEMRHTIGQHGFMIAEEAFGIETEYETTKGMKFYGNWADRIMVNRPEKWESVMNDCVVLVTNYEMNKGGDLIRRANDGIIYDLINAGKKRIVIIAPNFFKPFLEVVLKLAQQDNVFILGIKAPSLTTDQLEDITCYIGGRMIDKDKGISLSDITLEDFGNAKKVVANMDETIIVPEVVREKEVQQRIVILESQKAVEKADHLKKKIERRIASLSGGVGLIKVGGRTKVDRYYTRLKVEDAVAATKAAMEEGIVKGGGLALKEIAEKLPKNILTETLKTPYNQIQYSSGGKLEIPDSVIDPAKVVRIALENACAMAGVFITTEAAIVDPKEDLAEDLKAALFPQVDDRAREVLNEE